MTTALLTPPTTARRAAPGYGPGASLRAAAKEREEAQRASTGLFAVTPAGATRTHPETLADLVSGAWEGLVSARGVACIVCGGHMSPRYGASGPAPVGGRCDSCGSTLG